MFRSIYDAQYPIVSGARYVYVFEGPIKVGITKDVRGCIATVEGHGGRIQSPCKDCPDRDPCCWSSCPKYKAFCEVNKSLLELKKKARRIDDDFLRARQFKQVRLQKKFKGGF